MPPGQDYPLRQFTTRTHGTSQVVGYNKAAFVFFMLRDVLGPDAFDAGLRHFWRERQFQASGWDDLRRAFEQASGRDLGPFFAQWLDRGGAPSLRIEHASLQHTDAHYRIELTLAQTAPPYALRVPVRVATKDGEHTFTLDLTRDRQAFSLEVGSVPLSLSLDPEQRLFRQLDPREAPPILRQIMLDPATTTIILEDDPAFREVAATLAGKLVDGGVRIRAAPSDGPLLIIGTHQAVDRFLLQHALPLRPGNLRDKGTAQVWAAFGHGGKVVVCVSSRDLSALQALVRPLPHYGRQSWLVFDGPKAVDRGVWPGEPVVYRITP
jgi:hypothetical protein